MPFTLPLTRALPLPASGARVYTGLLPLPARGERVGVRPTASAGCRLRHQIRKSPSHWNTRIFRLLFHGRGNALALAGVPELSDLPALASIREPVEPGG